MRKLLIVEDEPILLEMLSAVVSTAGYEVLGATSFEEAKRLIDTAEPDLLIVDVRLGPYNGLHLVVRERLSHPNRPVIVTSAYADEVLVQEARRYGAEFLEKPLTAAELLALIKKLLPDEIPAGSV
ncbi:MAG TPA: response regulator [Vicinamibacterales bacterium]|nr:response regulator [Vicinamibacterales bacterium]